MIKVMRSLALNRPSTKWKLASKYSGKTKKGLTDLAYPTVLKSIEWLSKFGYVKEYGLQRKPTKRPGRPEEKKIESQPLIKHDALILYGLSFVGLPYIFMMDFEVRENWDAVEENYEEAKLNVWLGFARDWPSNPKLKIFPLKTEYSDVTRHDKLNPKLFVQSVIFSEVKSQESIERGIQEVVELLKKYQRRKAVTYIFWALERETAKYRRMLEQCKILEEKLKPLRYS